MGTPTVGQASLVLGQPNFTTTINPYLTQSGFRNPTYVATDGKILVVSDTDNNRVLLWKTIPTIPDQPADIVLGQPNFTTASIGLSSFHVARSARRVGAGNATVRRRHAEPSRDDLEQHPHLERSAGRCGAGRAELHHRAARHHQRSSAHRQQSIFAGVGNLRRAARLYVTDLGHNRVLIWNSIPTQNGQAADVVVGQQNMTSEVDNGGNPTCVSTTTDSDGNPTYPTVCPTICPFHRHRQRRQSGFIRSAAGSR